MKITVTGEFDDHDHENHEKEIEAFHNGVQHGLLFYTGDNRNVSNERGNKWFSNTFYH